jgi:hypothetical protein
LAAAALVLTHQAQAVGMGQILCFQRLLLPEEAVAALEARLPLKQKMEVLVVEVGVALFLPQAQKEMEIRQAHLLPVVTAPLRLLIRVLMEVPAL